jgi:hypothetical protein
VRRAASARSQSMKTKPFFSASDQASALALVAETT